MAVYDLSFGVTSSDTANDPNRRLIGIGTHVRSGISLETTGGRLMPNFVSLSRKVLQEEPSIRTQCDSTEHFVLIFDSHPDLDACLASYLLYLILEKQELPSQSNLEAVQDYTHKCITGRTQCQSHVTPYCLFLTLQNQLLEHLELLDKDRTNTRENLVRQSWLLFEELFRLNVTAPQLPIENLLIHPEQSIFSNQVFADAKTHYEALHTSYRQLIQKSNVASIEPRNAPAPYRCCYTETPNFGVELFNQFAWNDEIFVIVFKEPIKSNLPRARIRIEIAPSAEGDLMGLAEALNQVENSKRSFLHVDSSDDSNEKGTNQWRAQTEDFFKSVHSPEDGSVLSQSEVQALLENIPSWGSYTASNALLHLQRISKESLPQSIKAHLQNNLLQIIVQSGSKSQVQLLSVTASQPEINRRIFSRYGEDLSQETLEFHRRTAINTTWIFSTDVRSQQNILDTQLDYENPRDLVLEFFHYIRSGKTARILEFINTLAELGKTSLDALLALQYFLSSELPSELRNPINERRSYILKNLWALWVHFTHTQPNTKSVLSFFQYGDLILNCLLEDTDYAEKLIEQYLESADESRFELRILVGSCILRHPTASKKQANAFVIENHQRILTSSWATAIPPKSLRQITSHPKLLSVPLPGWAQITQLLSTGPVSAPDWKYQFATALEPIVTTTGRERIGTRISMAFGYIRLLEQLNHLEVTLDSSSKNDSSGIIEKRIADARNDITEEFLSLLPSTEGSAPEFRELVCSFLRTIPLNSDNTGGQFTRYLNLSVRGSTTLLSRMLGLSLLAHETPVQQLNFLSELLYLPRLNSLINNVHGAVFLPETKALLHYTKSTGDNYSHPYEQLKAMPLPMAIPLLEKTLLVETGLDTNVTTKSVTFISQSHQYDLSNIKELARIYEHLALKSNFHTNTSAQFLYLARRLDSFSSLLRIANSVPFCNIVFLLMSRVWALYVSPPSGGVRNQDWAYQLGQLLSDAQDLTSEQRLILAQLKTLTEKAYAIAAIGEADSLAGIVQRAGALAEECVYLKDSAEKTTTFLFVREVLAAIHGWATTFATVANNIVSALQKDTNMVLDVWVTQLIRTQVEQQVVHFLSETYHRPAQLAASLSQANPEDSLQPESTEAQNQLSQRVSRSIEELQSHFSNWNLASKLSEVGKWGPLGAPEMGFLSSSRFVLSLHNSPKALRRLAHHVSGTINRHTPQAKTNAETVLKSTKEQALKCSSFSHLGSDIREQISEKIAKELIAQFDLPAAERFMIAQSTTENRPSWILRLLTFKSSLTFPIYFFALFSLYYLSDQWMPASSLKNTLQGIVAPIFLFWIPVGTISLLLGSSFAQMVQRYVRSNLSSEKRVRKRSLLYDLLLPRYLISICFGVTTACIFELDFSPWGRLGDQQLLIIPALLGLSFWALHKHVAATAPRGHMRITIDIFSMVFSQAVLLALLVSVFFSPLFQAPVQDNLIAYRIPVHPTGLFFFYPTLALIFASVGLFFATFIEGILKSNREQQSQTTVKE